MSQPTNSGYGRTASVSIITVHWSFAAGSCVTT